MRRALAALAVAVIFAGLLTGVIPHPTAEEDNPQDETSPICRLIPSLPWCVTAPPPEPPKPVEPMPCH